MERKKEKRKGQRKRVSVYFYAIEVDWCVRRHGVHIMETVGPLCHFICVCMYVFGVGVGG